MSSKFEEFLELSNLVLIVIFTVEVVMNIAGYGVHYYTHDAFNFGDGFIVIFSLIEATWLTRMGLELSTIRVLRVVRVLRGLKIINRIKGLRTMFQATFNSFYILLDFLGLLALFIFVMALLGKGLFGGRFTVANGFSDLPRRNYENVGQAMFSVFQVITGEDWTNVLYDCMRVDPAVGGVYVYLIYLMGNHILLSLVIAILLDDFDFGDAGDGDTFRDAVNALNSRTETLESCVTGWCLDCRDSGLRSV